MRSSAVLLIALFGVIAPNAHAQTYPARSLTIVVAFPPGGGHDFTARTLAPRLASRGGQRGA